MALSEFHSCVNRSLHILQSYDQLHSAYLAQFAKWAQRPDVSALLATYHAERLLVRSILVSHGGETIEALKHIPV